MIRKNIDKYDISNDPKDHDIYSERYEKEIGKIKDETAEKQIMEFIGLRANYAELYIALIPPIKK